NKGEMYITGNSHLTIAPNSFETEGHFSSSATFGVVASNVEFLGSPDQDLASELDFYCGSSTNIAPDDCTIKNSWIFLHDDAVMNISTNNLTLGHQAFINVWGKAALTVAFTTLKLDAQDL